MAKLLTVSRKNHRLMETLKLNLPCNLNKFSKHPWFKKNNEMLYIYSGDSTICWVSTQSDRE